MRAHAAKCPSCGKIYRKSTALYFAVVLLILTGIALFIFSFNQGRQQTNAAQRELEEAAKAAGLQ